MLLTKTDQEDFQKKVREAIEASFSGWDFSYINEYGGKPELICHRFFIIAQKP
ncbi:MAG: hypothetical protein JXJ04_15305 [Spirochaetales bacterium]|nr:hypothetical protein [Spirochaetales bacterium]